MRRGLADARIFIYLDAAFGPAFLRRYQHALSGTTAIYLPFKGPKL
jgi:hypothetical protein